MPSHFQHPDLPRPHLSYREKEREGENDSSITGDVTIEKKKKKSSKMF